jgi:hypothetical protein
VRRIVLFHVAALVTLAACTRSPRAFCGGYIRLEVNVREIADAQDNSSELPYSPPPTSSSHDGWKSASARVAVRVERDIELWLDDALLARGPVQGVVHVEAGVHSVEARARGGGSRTRDFLVPAGTSQLIDAWEFERPPADPK